MIEDLHKGIETLIALYEAQTTGAFFLITLGLMEGLHEGEWEWTLSLDDGNIVTGLMQVLASQDDAVQYNKEIQYKQYGELKVHLIGLQFVKFQLTSPKICLL